MTYQLTRDAVLKSLQEDHPQEQYTPPTGLQESLRSAGDFANKSGVTAFGTHALAAPLHLAENVLNIPQAWKGNPNVAEPFRGLINKIPEAHIPDKVNPEKWFDVPNTPITRGAGLAGDILGIGGGESLIARGLNRALGVGARTPLLARAALGAGQGYATSNDKSLGGRLGGAGLGALASGLTNLSNTRIGQKAIDIGDEIAGHFRNRYNSIFHTAEQEGAGHVHVPSDLRGNNIDIRNIRHFGNRMRGQNNLAIDRFLEEPTLGNAHWAQSRLGEIERSIQHDYERGRHIGSEGINALRAIPTLRQNIQAAMDRSFGRAGLHHLADAYRQVGQDFAQHGTHFLHPSVLAGRRGTNTASDVAKDLLSSREFGHGEGARMLPGYRTRQRIAPLSNAAGEAGRYGLFRGAGHFIGRPGMDYISQLLEGLS